ncbi:MAG: hypothetical protein ACTSYI_08690 [Promethearchaeota archaeon]
MSKKVGIFITIGVIICVLGGGGIFGGLYYQAVSQIEVDIDDIYITGSSIGGTPFNPTVDVDLEIHASISNPTSMAVEIDYALFEIYFDGLYTGEGQTSSFAATQTPSPMQIDMVLEDLGLAQSLILYDLIKNGNSKVVTIRITTVHAFGFAIDLNKDINVTVSRSDVL